MSLFFIKTIKPGPRFARLFIVGVGTASMASCGDSRPSPQDSPPATVVPTTEAAGSPTTTAIAAGGDQTAVVETAVPVRPALLLTDAQKRPVRGIAVTFTITKGGGSLWRGVVRTNASGIATVGSWRLGPTPGANELKAEVPGLGPVFFRARGLPDQRGAFTKERGDFQTARVGTAVGIVPRVVFKTREGTPVPGRTVTFTVVSGGGKVTPAKVTTNAEGRASPTSWTLGPNLGKNVLRASLQGLPPLEFSVSSVSNEEPLLAMEDVVTGVSSPWEVAFLPSGEMIFTERVGRIGLLPKGQSTPITIAQPSDVDPTGQSGLLGLALDPAFASNRTFYTFISVRNDGKTDNRIRKWKLADDARSATAVGDILKGMRWGAEGGHSGGRLRFGSDGFLYATTGDIRTATIPQDLTALGGKIIRVTTTGAPAPGNPNLGAGSRPEIYAYGYRNPQGLAVRTVDRGGGMFTCEHGPNQDDEVSPVVLGGNGGWNPNDGKGNYNGYSGAKMTDTNRFPNAVRPLYAASDSQGMSTCAFLRGAQWKSWDGSLLVGFLAGERIEVVDINAAGTGLDRAARIGFNGLGRIRALTQGPDGNLYVSVDPAGAPGRIVRVRPR